MGLSVVSFVGSEPDKHLSRFQRSGILTLLALLLILAFLFFACRTRRETLAAPVVPVVDLNIGGRVPVTLSRPQTDAGLLPEFVSATLLPGRGMNILQINAYLPSVGIIPLLDAPTPEQVQSMLAHPGADLCGSYTANVGAPFFLPFDARISGTTAPDGLNINVPWRNRSLVFPADSPGARTASYGLMNDQAASDTSVETEPDGQIATAVFNPGNFNGRWPSSSQITYVVSLSRKVIEITVTALNTGSEPEPMAIGWRPNFRLPSGHRSQALLRLPVGDRIETGPDGSPTGRFIPVSGPAYDFTTNTGTEFGTLPLDVQLIHLRNLLAGDIPVTELQDKASKFGIRITPMSPSIKVIHATSPATAPVVTLAPLMSQDEPFNRPWPEPPGVVTLNPGDSVQWKIQLEIYLPPQHTITN